MKKIILFLVAVMVIFSLSVNVNAKSEFKGIQSEDSNSCYSLDVIFVVDQSGSMTGPIHPTDPTNQRETAIEAMVDWLAENALDVCPDARHQVGVISFGYKPRVEFGLREVAPDSIEELLALEDELHEKVVADEMGYTDPLKAFELIQEMFEDSKITTGGIRKRVVIFLTDGQIDLGDGGSPEGYTQKLVNYINNNLPFDKSLLAREQCVSFQAKAYDKLENVPYEKLNECYKNNIVEDSAYENSTYLFMVLMNYGSAWPKSIRQMYDEVATSHAGEAKDFYNDGKENRNEIPAYFQNVLATLAGVPTGVVSCGSVAINPYLEKAVFVFYKFSPDTKVSLRYTDTSGQLHQMVGGESENGGFEIEDYQKYGTNERYIFTKPYPGVWFIESDRCANGGINAFYQEVQVNAGGFVLPFSSLPVYDLTPYYDTSAPTYLTYQMHNDAGEVVGNSDQSIFSINAKAVVTDSSGKETSYILEWNQEDQLFRSTEPLQVPLVGPYTVSITGITKIHAGELSGVSESLPKTFDTDKVLFFHPNLEFKVENVIPFVIDLKSPKDKVVLPQIHATILQGWPLRVTPIPVSVKIKYRDRTTLNVPDESVNSILTDPNNALEAWVVAGDGTESEHVILKQNLEVPDEFSGDIPGNDSELPMTLHVRLSGETQQGYRPDMREVTAVFSRQDKNPFYRSGFYIFLMILLIIAMILAILKYIYDHTDPVRGKLIIQMNSVPVRTEDLYSGQRTTKFKYSHEEGVDLGKIWIKYMPKVKASEDDQEAPREIKIWGQTEHKTKISIDGLAPGTSASYCTEHIEYSFLYESEK